MRAALRLRRLRTCVRCPWIRVDENHRLWPLRFLHLQRKIRRQLALKAQRRITRRVGSSKDSADFLPRYFGDAPRRKTRQAAIKLDGSLRWSRSGHTLRALFQDYGHFKQCSIGIFAGLPTEFIESRALK
jgi:hypothetical protein